MSIESSLHRRGFFQHMAGGLCGASLAWLLEREAAGIQHASPSAPPAFDLKPRSPHLPVRARAVIHLFMNGGPSQMDLFDPKPMLDQLHGTDRFQKFAGEIENLGSVGTIMRSPFKFAQHGQSGMWMSDALPHLAQHVDDIAMIRSMQTTNLTHEPAIYLMQTGKMGPGRPSFGSWVVYGLGSENQNLPAYVVLDDPLGLPVNGIENWQAGFLPPQFQGTRFRSNGSPVLNLRADVARSAVLEDLERGVLAGLDRAHQAQRPFQPRLEARISNYELAARMQLEATDALDLSQETAATLESYGLNGEKTESYGRRCLIARRLVERGVRFVQLYINGQIWDNHSGLESGLKQACARTDQPIAALLTDLKQRGLLDETLVIWSSEFGRLPIAQIGAGEDPRTAGRDHNKNAFCCWLAGAGVKKGGVHGATDDLGFAAVENVVTVPDWHATTLQLMGLNHEHLFVEMNGLRERMTGVSPARVVREILA